MEIEKIQRSCGCGDDTFLPELIEKIPCPECGTLNYRVIPKYFRGQKGQICKL